MTRRLIGWRVRWLIWRDGWSGWEPCSETWLFVHPTLQRHARSEARTFARGLSGDDARNVRLMRVYRRSKR